MTFIRTILRRADEPTVDLEPEEIVPDNRTLLEKQAETINIHLTRLHAQLIETDEEIHRLGTRKHELQVSIRALQAAADILEGKDDRAED